MSKCSSRQIRKSMAAGFAVVAGILVCAAPLQARITNNDPRLSLEERYADHAGYVAAVSKAAANAVAQGFLLQKDADALIAAADASSVLK